MAEQRVLGTAAIALVLSGASLCISVLAYRSSQRVELAITTPNPSDTWEVLLSPGEKSLGGYVEPVRLELVVHAVLSNTGTKRFSIINYELSKACTEYVAGVHERPAKHSETVIGVPRLADNSYRELKLPFVLDAGEGLDVALLVPYDLDFRARRRLAELHTIPSRADLFEVFHELRRKPNVPIAGLPAAPSPGGSTTVVGTAYKACLWTATFHNNLSPRSSSVVFSLWEYAGEWGEYIHSPSRGPKVP